MANPISSQPLTDAAAKDSMALMDKATADIVTRQAQQNIQSAETDATLSNASQVAQTMQRASSI